MSWTEEKVNKLKELWGKGKTASQIAEIIGGISRNAVIGKAHRLNLSAKIKNKLKKVSKKDRYRLSVSRSSKNISAQIIDDKNNITILSASSNEKSITFSETFFSTM